MGHTEIHNSCQNISGIFEEGSHSAQRYWGQMILICACPRKHILFLLWRQPLRFSWKIRNKEKRCDANQDSQHSLQYEYPPPIAQSSDTIHISNTRGQEASERASDDYGCPVHGESFVCFFTLIPEANEIEACTSISGVFFSILTYLLPGKIPASKNPRRNRVAKRP